MSELRLKKTCTVALRDYLGLDASEVLLIITDENMRETAQYFFHSAHKLCKDVALIEMKPGNVNGEEPPQIVADCMRNADVVLCITSVTMNHTDAVKIATNVGVRVGTMPGITQDTIIRLFPNEYSLLVDKTERIKQLMENCEEVKVQTTLGTDITFPVKNRRVISSTGILHNIGVSGNIPSGEASITPWEDKANGTLVIDGTIAGIGKVVDPVTIVIEDGIAQSFSGKGSEAKVLSRMLNKFGDDGKSIAEFGIGTNPFAIEIGNILEDEKVEGMVHVSFGNNTNLGGRIKVPIHIDATITHCDVFFDGEKVISKGRLLF